MDGVPLKIPQAPASPAVPNDISITVPDYLAVLRETEYEFTLENWVLTGLQSGFVDQQRPPPPSSSSSGLSASCPPYWMMFSSPQQSRLASRHSSDFWEPNPRQRSRSLNLAVLRAGCTASDSEEDGGSAVQDTTIIVPEKAHQGGTGVRPAGSGQPGQTKARKAFVPDLLNPPSCLSSLPHRRRKNLRQCSLSGGETSSSDSRTRSPGPRRAPNTRANTLSTVGRHDTTDTPSPGPECCRRPLAASALRDLSSALDSSSELLSALSPEEREVLGSLTGRGYPLRTAIAALQRTGRQNPDQILSYLVACDHLCQMGYDMAQVEEALEMFHNCETKAQEFLHLLRQFNEMGFQQNAIKEVLLVHDNHRDRALEELMMRVS
ncbi:ubiquitin-associated protein 1-like [Cololabis saira]|uniref:ubiquitin-associated protein 1-like n=1 Tax=Cololabis saira TaxID=129043 RepID=UPI002AD4D2CE|nr:ubiquitin-associated protein 1-like [Cololabis saira]XP_061564571.1 ubiquitin-associated protein 1-like [Cololabis saira]